MQLPAALTTAIAALLEGVPRADMIAAAQKQSEGYRKGATSGSIVTPAQAAAYAIARMPATYAACAAVFARLAEVMPDFAPASLLDVGAGTGAASWAAVTQWPGIASVHHAGSQPRAAQPGAQVGGWRTVGGCGNPVRRSWRRQAAIRSHGCQLCAGGIAGSVRGRNARGICGHRVRGCWR